MPRLRVPSSPVSTMQLGQLHVFGQWCKRFGVNGLIGEIGWPNSLKGDDAVGWNEVAEEWFEVLGHYGLGALVWGAVESSPTVILSPYIGTVRATPPTTPLSVTVSPGQHSVLAAHRPAGAIRGVAIRGLAEGAAAPYNNVTQAFSNLNPGVHGVDYWSPFPASIDYLAAQGEKTLRLTIRWERVQPTLLAALDSAQVGYIQAITARAAANGQNILLDIHNGAAYYSDDGEGVGHRHTIGTAQVGNAEFSDLWSRLASVFKSDPGIWGYDLMNEPWSDGATQGITPAIWESASQAAVNAIRATGDVKNLVVEGVNWSKIQTFTTYHPQPWIVDPANKTWYSPHQYFDPSGGGYGDNTPPQDYDYCQAYAASQGFF